MWTIESPEYLLLLLLLPPGIYLRHFWKGRGGRIVFPVSVWNGEGFAAPIGLHGVLLGLSAAAFWTGLACLIVAMAGPIHTVRERAFLTRGIDIMIVLDESPSMAAQDYPPVNRFETAKNMIRQFVAQRENDPVGLVSFGSEAALRVPPTLDYDVFLSRLESLTLMDLGEGTAIGMGLAVACLHLRESTATQKIIILITDGENNSGEIQPETAASIASQLGIKLYTIGIGTTDEVPFEYTDPASGRTLRGMYQGTLGDELLKKAAASTGGSYFYAGSPGTLRAVFNTIDSIETVEKRVRIRVRSEPGRDPFILAGLVLLLVKFVIRKLLLREVL